MRESKKAPKYYKLEKKPLQKSGFLRFTRLSTVEDIAGYAPRTTRRDQCGKVKKPPNIIEKNRSYLDRVAFFRFTRFNRYFNDPTRWSKAENHVTFSN